MKNKLILLALSISYSTIFSNIANPTKYFKTKDTAQSSKESKPKYETVVELIKPQGWVNITAKLKELNKKNQNAIAKVDVCIEYQNGSLRLNHFNCFEEKSLVFDTTYRIKGFIEFIKNQKNISSISVVIKYFKHDQNGPKLRKDSLKDIAESTNNPKYYYLNAMANLIYIHIEDNHKYLKKNDISINFVEMDINDEL